MELEFYPLSKRRLVGAHLLLLLLVVLVLNSLGNFRSEAQVLLDSEVQMLQQISTKYRIRQWNVDPNSCRTGQGLNAIVGSNSISNVTCDCSFNSSTICRVTNIQLKSLNLTGLLPEEFGKLSFLREIDLTLNYFNGSIPSSWTRLPLVTLSIQGNFASGSIPREIGNISTLEELVVQDNQITGSLPNELGKLTSLKRFIAGGNNFRGVIPEAYGDLKNLTTFRIDGSSLSGRIPDFIGNWTKLDRLDMQGTSMEGPIPSAISLLTNLTQLRISDLQGPNISFPNLQNLTKLTELVLRNCSINGPIPLYIAQMMPSLKKLDLSFNRLTGTVPDNLQGLNDLQYMYLTNNSLTGQLPPWILNTVNNFFFDISYNNYSGSSFSSCQEKNVNKISSYSSVNDNSINWCLKKGLPCPTKPNYYSLFINCGGSKLNADGEEYEQDLDIMGPSSFFSTNKWASSSTGDFLGFEKSSYVVSASTQVTDGDLYMTARVAPVSLKYYGTCLRQGSYKVKLHFAEIRFIPNQENNSPGRRIFDVAIQGSRVLEDFNIAERAGGLGKSIVKEYDVNVTGSTLEIHLYWTGKGTTGVPVRGVYGPLISAISVTPNFDPSTGGGLAVGVIVGIVVGSCVLVLLVLAILWKTGYLGGKDENKELRRGLESQTGYFTLRQIKAATGDFDSLNKIGEGGFGPVYKGVLSDGSVIAVKQLSAKSRQGNREFVNEIGMISALQHPNLVKLMGCCIEGNQLLLVYEYMENNSLARALFGRPEQRLNLDWPTRRKICLGIAKGLAYLHEESRLKIVHRDIKATNVLLDKDLNAKISDFGLAKLDEEENTHISTRIAGTIGYMAPEYAMRGYLTDKADVYSFGVVTLEIVSGKSNTNYRPMPEFVYLLDWAYVLQEQGNLLELVDPSLGSKYSKDEALRMLNLGVLCSNPSPTLRPSMSAVVSMLEGKMKIQAPLVERTSTQNNMRFKAFEKLSQDSQTQASTFSQDREAPSSSVDVQSMNSLISIPGKEDSMYKSSSSKLLPDLDDSETSK